MDEENKKIRHTITAEETFTLAKDVFDMRTFIKNVYANRAVIARRINVVTLSVSMIFTLLYTSFMLYKTLTKTISFGVEIAVYVIIGVYAVMAALLIMFFILSSRAKTKSLKKFSLTLKIFRTAVKVLSIAVSISAIVVAESGDGSAVLFAVDVLFVILSVFTIIVQSLPLLFGGLGRFVRWLLSPVKIKYRFTTVLLEWYNLIITGEPAKGAAARVAKKHYEPIGALIDGVIVPQLGNKYITAIKPVMLLNLVENCSETERPILEGILKSVFAYAAECGYVVFDPCRDLNFEGTIEEKRRKTMKEKLFGVGTKIGKKVLDKYIAASTEEEEKP